MRAHSSSQRSQGESPTVEPRGRGGSGSSSRPPMLEAMIRRSARGRSAARLRRRTPISPHSIAARAGRPSGSIPGLECVPIGASGAARLSVRPSFAASRRAVDNRSASAGLNDVSDHRAAPAAHAARSGSSGAVGTVVGSEPASSSGRAHRPAAGGPRSRRSAPAARPPRAASAR